jgi:hypothetical protein
MQLQLFMTEHCHLCELAEAQLNNIRPSLSWQKTEIAYDEALVTRYGLSIPVLKRDDNQLELHWPFTIEQILQFIR